MIELQFAPGTAVAAGGRDLRSNLGRVVGFAFDVSQSDLDSPTRREAPIAFARQVAMYLAHVGFGLSLTEVGALFGRDRTTVAHACERIEDGRDDARLDRCLDVLEAVARCDASPWRPRPRAATTAAAKRGERR